MIYNQLLVALACSSAFVGVALADPRGGGGGNKGAAANATAGSGVQALSGAALTAQDALNPANVQSGSATDGQGQASGVKAGQAASATDPANFINFCTGKTLTNGLQVKGGSCNGIPMGDIPAATNMVSTIITNPAPGQDIAANTAFNVNLQVANLNAGVFTNPTVTYYTAPQALKGGNIIGHVHVTIQTLGANLTPATPPDASKFTFFKGIDDAGDGKGGLTAAVAGGLPAGSYRVCSMSAAANHQPVTMPLAQRGAQDDCTKFTVGGAAAGGGAAKAGGGAANAGTASSSAAAGASTAASSAGGKGKGKGKGKGRGGRTVRRNGLPEERFVDRAFVE